MLAGVEGSPAHRLPRVTVWGAIPDGLPAELARRLRAEVAPAEEMPVSGTQAPVPKAYAGAVALALSDSNAAARPVDFVHSRLAERRQFRLGRRAYWAAALALTVLIAIVATVLDWRARRNELDELNERLEALAPEMEAATQVIDRVSEARGWYDRRPPFLECLRAISLAFPEDGRIWTNSLAVREDMRCVVSGKATDDGLILRLLDAFKGSEQFQEVKLLYVRAGQGSDRSSAFAIGFTFVPSE